MADDNQKYRNILENSNFLKHRCCLEDRAFLSNSIELVQRENFLALDNTSGEPRYTTKYRTGEKTMSSQSQNYRLLMNDRSFRKKNNYGHYKVCCDDDALVEEEI